MATIFISYRRADSASEAGRIYDRLAEHYGRERVFKDVDSIPAGANFPEYIAESIRASDIALVVIGPRWFDASAGWGRRRLDDPADFVRVEIETALRLGVPVIPILIGGASLSPARHLPESLRPLLRQNGLAVRQDPDFTRDMERVFSAIDYWQAQPRRAPEPAPAKTSLPAPSIAINVAQPLRALRPERTTATEQTAHAPAMVAEAPHPTAHTALGKRLTVAPSRQRPAPRAILAVSLISALMLAAVGAAALHGGVIASLFLSRTTTQPTETVVIASSAPRTEAYTPTGIGPCAKQKESYSDTNPFYWKTLSQSALSCQNGSMPILTRQSELDFYGFPNTPRFPRAFVASVKITFISGDVHHCVNFNAVRQESSTDNPPVGVRLCRDGSVQTYNLIGYDTPRHIAATTTYQLMISSKASDVSFRVNNIPVTQPHPYTNPVTEISISLDGDQTDSVSVSDFVLTPIAS